MVNKFVDKITDEIWGRWLSIPIFGALSIVAATTIIISVLSFLSYTITENNLSYNVPKAEGVFVSIVIAVSFIGLNVWYLIFVISQNCIKRASRGKKGILISIDTDDKQIYKETIRKFGEGFQNNLFSGLEVIYVPFRMKKIDYCAKSIVPFLRKKHGVLYLNIKIDYDTDGVSLIYDMQINGTIIHALYADNVEKTFQKVLSNMFEKFQNIVFPSKEMIKRLRVTAAELSLACQYVIAISLFLNGDFDSAESVFLELIKRNNTNEQWNKIHSSIQRMRHEMFITKAMIHMEKYQRYCDEESILENVDIFLEKAKECCGMTYEYCLNKAYYYVAKKRDSKKASELINICKQMKHVPQTWKYSEAFLKAYENKSINAIVTSYKSALRITYNLSDLIVFIESVLEREPQRSGLFLAVGILYKTLGDEELANENIRKYIDCSADCNKTMDILKNKGLFK